MLSDPGNESIRGLKVHLRDQREALPVVLPCPDVQSYPTSAGAGGTWYSGGKDFETEFVEILNQQCHRYLKKKLEKAKESPDGPLSDRERRARRSGRSS